MDRYWKIRNAQLGVTLVEIMVVIAITGIIATIGLPSYRVFMVKNRISSIASDLHGSLLLARSEALVRRLPVGVCKTSNPDDTAVACDFSGSAAGSNVGWGSGWIVYVDANGNGLFDLGDVLVRVSGRSFARPSDGSMVPSNGIEQVTFGFAGQTPMAVNFVISGPSGFEVESRAVCLAIGGRARVGLAPNCPAV